VERRHPSSQEASAASDRRLRELLAERQQSYDEFVWAITPNIEEP
jgi:hypothetical protein